MQRAFEGACSKFQTRLRISSYNRTVSKCAKGRRIAQLTPLQYGVTAICSSSSLPHVVSRTQSLFSTSTNFLSRLIPRTRSGHGYVRRTTELWRCASTALGSRQASFHQQAAKYIACSCCGKVKPAQFTQMSSTGASIRIIERILISKTELRDSILHTHVEVNQRSSKQQYGREGAFCV